MVFARVLVILWGLNKHKALVVRRVTVLWVRRGCSHEMPRGITSVSDSTTRACQAAGTTTKVISRLYS